MYEYVRVDKGVVVPFFLFLFAFMLIELSASQPPYSFKVIDINLNGPFHFCHAVLPIMRANKSGTIINVTSIAGLRALPLAGSSYCASKFGMNSLGSMINKEESEHGIRCTNICPGEVVTEILDKRQSPPTAKERERMVMPEDVAEIAIMVAKMPPRVIIPSITVTGRSTIDLCC